jgi:hypothetical protein
MAFLMMFGVTESKKLLPVSAENLIKCQQSMGPCFGEDLMIADRCDTNLSSSAFPTTYNVQRKMSEEPIEEYERCQEITKLFCGASEGQQFKVQEYEVFKIIRNE